MSGTRVGRRGFKTPARATSSSQTVRSARQLNNLGGVCSGSVFHSQLCSDSTPHRGISYKTRFRPYQASNTSKPNKRPGEASNKRGEMNTVTSERGRVWGKRARAMRMTRHRATYPPEGRNETSTRRKLWKLVAAKPSRKDHRTPLEPKLLLGQGFI